MKAHVVLEQALEILAVFETPFVWGLCPQLSIRAAQEIEVHICGNAYYNAYTVDGNQYPLCSMLCSRSTDNTGFWDMFAEAQGRLGHCDHVEGKTLEMKIMELLRPGQRGAASRNKYGVQWIYALSICTLSETRIQ